MKRLSCQIQDFQLLVHKKPSTEAKLSRINAFSYPFFNKHIIDYKCDYLLINEPIHNINNIVSVLFGKYKK